MRVSAATDVVQLWTTPMCLLTTVQFPFRDCNGDFAHHCELLTMPVYFFSFTLNYRAVSQNLVLCLWLSGRSLSTSPEQRVNQIEVSGSVVSAMLEAG